ncbi:hypothetical protein T02_5619, partial [Trichinella nativa]
LNALQLQKSECQDKDKRQRYHDSGHPFQRDLF